MEDEEKASGGRQPPVEVKTQVKIEEKKQGADAPRSPGTVSGHGFFIRSFGSASFPGFTRPKSFQTPSGPQA